MTEYIPAKHKLGNRKLVTDVIPAGVEAIGDWAYAHCINLKQIAIPFSVQTLGKNVFLGCNALTRVFFYDNEIFTEGSLYKAADDPVSLCAGLNAVAVRFFSSPSEVLMTGGDVTADILRQWDEQCLEYLEIPDDTGFSPFLAGGEEDYSEGEDQLTKYRQERQRNKAYVMFTRLITEDISEFPFDRGYRNKLADYFRCCPGALPLLNEIDGNYTETAALYTETGLITSENLPEVFEMINSDKVELRSALINIKSRKTINDLVL